LRLSSSQLAGALEWTVDRALAAAARMAALAATHPVLPAIRAITHAEGEAIRSSRRAWRS
jgi:hypothetical protein